MNAKTRISIVLFVLVLAASLNGVAFSARGASAPFADIPETPTPIAVTADGPASAGPPDALPANLDFLVYLPVVARETCHGFFDDFSASASGWEVVDSENVRSAYTGGEFLVHTKKSGYIYLFSAPACRFRNYTLEVDARWLGRPGQSYGLIFDIQDGFSYYDLFDINTDYQQFRFLRRSPAGFASIVPVTGSPAIHTGGASNHLKISYIDGQITLFVNGVELGAWPGSGLATIGGVGIVSGPYTNRPVSDALFDDFYLAGLPDVNGLVSSATGINAGIPNPPRLENLAEPATEDLGW